MTRFITFICISAIGLLASAALAQTDTTFTYQGRLLDGGNPATGPHDFDVRLWDAASGGSQIGLTLTFPAVPVEVGLFTLELDFGANVFDNSNRWLELTVNTVLLSPRQPVTRVPYAIQTRGIFVDEDQDVGIGTTRPTSPLHVRLTTVGQAVRIESTDPTNNFTALGVTHTGSAPAMLAWNTGTGHAGEFRVFSPNNAAALRGLNQGAGNAGLFEITNAANSAPAIYAQTNGASGTAVFGRATATSGLTTYGGRFESDVPGGRGVSGYATASTGAGTGVYGRSDSSIEGRGVRGHATATSGNTRGGDFKSDSTNGIGVFGWAPATSGTTRGVVGQSNSNSGRGVYGQAVSSTGVTYGVYGLSQSPEGRGVLGIATSSTGLAYGVLGETQSTSGSAAGVYGRVNSFSPGPNSAAVRGENRGRGASGIGVHGTQNGSGWGVYGRAPDGIGVRGSGGEYDFYAAGPGTNYGSGSSIRWKSNVRNIDQPLEKVARLRGVYFDWDAEHGGHHDLGMIAEEVGEVLPEIVNYEENGIDAIGMDYSKMTPLLVEAVNALRSEKNRQLAEKDEQITELRAANTALESRMAQLEEALMQLAQQVTAQQGDQQ